jgi:hypothetical protein
MDVKMVIKTSFFDVMSEVYKDLEDVSAGIHPKKTIHYIRILPGI